MSQVAFRKDWREAGHVNRLVQRLNDGTELNPEGSITFQAHDHDDLFFLLADCIIYPADVTRSDVWAISYRAFLNLRKTGRVDSARLLKEMGRRIADLEKAPRKVYTMWSKMRLRQMSSSKCTRFEIDGVKVRTAARLPKWLKIDEHFVSGVGRIKPDVLPSFGYIIFAVEARNENEAAKRIFNACDCLYAIVNTAWRSSELWIQRRSTAKLWLGPNQFFFEDRKFSGLDRVWYSLDYDEESWNLFPQNAADFARRSKTFRKILARLQAHPLQEELTKALILISEGMASRDLAFRLMRFWSALETLYSEAEERTNVKKLVARLTFASKEDSWLDKLKINRVYQLRNSYVHGGSRESDDSSLVQHLRELLLNQIYYFVFNGSDIESHRELIMMVDLTADEKVLDQTLLAVQRRKSILLTGRHLPLDH